MSFYLRRILQTKSPVITKFAEMSQLGDLGSGAGKGGGGGGSIREAGGAFGKMEAAREEEYFHRKQQEQIHKLHNDIIKQEDFHKEQIQEHEQAIKRHNEFLENIKKGKP